MASHTSASDSVEASDRPLICCYELLALMLLGR
jgi:hypothetical protein